MLKLPNFPEGFTRDFLTRVLHADGVLPKRSTVESIEHAQIAEGSGMMAELASLKVTYAGDPGEAPAAFIAKFSSRNPTNREVALQYRLYERETRFFSDLSPNARVRVPRIYYSGVDEDRFLILMDDLSDYRVGNQIEGATLEQATLAIEELARLHAAFWNRMHGVDWVPRVARSYHASFMMELAGIGFDGVIAKFGDAVPDHLPGRKTALLRSVGEIQARLDQGETTLCHGDFRVENLLYGQRPDHDAIVVIDWQGVLIGRGMLDVAQFLAQSTPTETRRQHERQLLARYADTLAAGGVTGLDAESTWQDYRYGVLYGWIYTCVVAGTLDSANERGRAWMAQMVARQAAAADDLDLYALLT